MFFKRYLLACILTVFALFVSLAYSQAENKNVLELAPSGVLEVDILQSLAEDDKSGSAGVGRLETGIEASAGDKVEAALFLELGDDNAIGLLETWFTFKPVEVLSLTAGQLTMPFGEYATQLMTDPLLMSGYAIDSTAEVAGAETIFPGFIAGVEIAGFSAAFAAYNSSYTERFEAFAAKIVYSLKENFSAGVSSRFEASKKIDIDANLSLSPWSFLALIGEVYIGLNDEESDNKLLGIHSELDVMPVNPLVLAVRFGRLVDNNAEGTGCLQLSGGAKYSVNDHITFGIEANLNAEIVDGKAGNLDKFLLRIGCSIN